MNYPDDIAHGANLNPEHPSSPFYDPSDDDDRESRKIEIADELIKLPQKSLHNSIDVAGCKYDFSDVVYRCKDFYLLVSKICTNNEEQAMKAVKTLINNMYVAALVEAETIVDELISDEG